MSMNIRVSIITVKLLAIMCKTGKLPSPKPLHSKPMSYLSKALGEVEVNL